MSAALHQIFSPAGRKRLAQAIPQRVSCRSFAAAPSVADWAALSYAAGRYTLPGARLILTHVDESVFAGTLLGLGRITGCRAIAAVVTDGTAQGRMHAGVIGEILCLEATALGLGSCWVGGSYKKKLLQLPLQPQEDLLCVIALGVPAALPDSETRKRKALPKLCRGDVSLWPQELQAVAAAVQLSPSGMNSQPWLMALEQDRFILETPERSLLELGIALTHAELTLTTAHTWHFDGACAWAQVRG